MYIVDFFKNLFKKNNIGTIIWMILNIAIICTIFILGAQPQNIEDAILAGLIGFLVYFISVAIALSPIGEMIMRWQQGCKKIGDPQIIARLEPIFQEVYANAKKLNPEIPNNVKLYINNDASPNAFAMGRHTVCCTRGLLAMSDDDIKGILGHEFGHLAHKDTDTLLVMTVGNLIVSAIFVIWRFMFNLIARVMNIIIGIASDSFGALIAGFLVRIFVDFLLGLAMTIWTKLGVIICMSSSRANEYLADRYSCQLGYGNHLSVALRKLDSSSYSVKGIWAALSSSHPDTQKRLAKINEFLIGAIK